MNNIDYLRKEIRKLWKTHKEITDKIESLECQLAIELENAEKENKDKTEKLSDKEKNLIKKYDGDIEKLNKELNGYKNKKNLSDDDIKKIDDLKNEINNLTDKKYVILGKY